MSVGCGTVVFSLQACHSQLTHARYLPCAFCVASPEDEQVMLEICRGLWFSINWMKSAPLWFNYTDYVSIVYLSGCGEVCVIHSIKLVLSWRLKSSGVLYSVKYKTVTNSSNGRNVSLQDQEVLLLFLKMETLRLSETSVTFNKHTRHDISDY
jgi:hypothetical protein